MKKVFKMAAFMLCAAFMMTACNCSTSCKSDENKKAQFEKAASEFKATLESGNVIIGERIDSVVQKVFYIVPNSEGSIENIEMHDYATNGVLSILPDPVSENIGKELSYAKLAREMGEEFNCFNLQYQGSELIGDRLFFVVHAECTFDMETSIVYYVNVLDNTLHYVAECDAVKFDKANGSMEIHKQLLKQAGEDLEHSYNLSASLSDDEYVTKRNENEEIENQMVEKWREENVD
jgi:hypothetical protein